jgi:hypothetical protein
MEPQQDGAGGSFVELEAVPSNASFADDPEVRYMVLDSRDIMMHYLREAMVPGRARECRRRR